MFTLLISDNGLGHQLDIPGKGSPQLKNYVHQIGLCHVCEVFFFFSQWLIDVGKANPL